MYGSFLYNERNNLDLGFKDIAGQNIPGLVTYARWVEMRCRMQKRNSNCIQSVLDLPDLKPKREYLTNKFMLSIDPIAYQCAEELYEERAYAGMNNPSFNLTFYCEFMKTHSHFINECSKLI